MICACPRRRREYLIFDLNRRYLISDSFTKHKPAMNKIELEERLIDFSVAVIKIASKLRKTKPASIIENQILRSATSCALNYGEALGAESTRDFIHKVQIVLKELRETHIALRIINKSRLCTDEIMLKKGLDENNQLISIFVKSVNTLRNNIKIHDLR